jgi:hypothetical protein
MNKMKKYLFAILFILLLSAGIIVGLILVQQNQIFKQKAATPTGTGTVSIQPAIATFERNTAYPISVYFNTKGISVSQVLVRLTFSNLGVTATNIQIDPNFLADGNWSCPTKSISSTGSVSQIDISCVNSGTTGFSVATDTLLGTFNLTATQVPIQNPLILSFDGANSTMTQKSDNSDILLTPSSTGSYTIIDTIAQSPTASPLIIVASPTPTPSGLALLATASPSPTVSPTATATASSAAIATATVTAKPSATLPPIPVTGFDLPTIIGGGAAVLLMAVGAIALIL